MNIKLQNTAVALRMNVKGHFPYLRSSLARRFQLWSLAMAIGAASALAQTEDRVEIAPLGNKVQLTLETSSQQNDYVLESVAELMEGEEWAPLLQFRGSASPRPFVDSICGTLESRFFRLRQLLDAPAVEVSNFRLIDTNGRAQELYYQQSAIGVVVVLAGADLTSVLPFISELERIRDQAGEENLPVWIISASAPSDRESIAEVAKSFPANFPVLQDPSHALHRTLGTGSAPEALLISPSNWSLVYRGPVEEITDTGAGIVHTRPLADAASELAAENPVSLSRVAIVGEPAGLRTVEPADYSTDIAPLLLNSCMPCHSEGNIAPWAMTDYAVINEFSRLIKSAVLTGEMPPWHADPAYQHFENSKALAPEDIDLLVNWIDRGSPRGDGPDPLAEVRQQPFADWPLGEPDAIISIAPQAVPANGVIDYRYLVARSPFPEDVWLRAVSLKPGDRSVVHHCLVFKGSTSELLAFQGGLSGFFAGYVPGMDQVPFPEGTGKRLTNSDVIVFQIHYTASGRATTDTTELGFYLAESKPARELVTTAAFDLRFVIPPKVQDMPVSASLLFEKNSLIYELSPHMHYRGASARFTLEYPDGDREVLLNVPKYFFDWQALYRLETPKEVPAGTRLLVEGEFDNSVRNRFNPDPNATVRFGEQSWDEMFIGYVNFSQIQ